VIHVEIIFLLFFYFSSVLYLNFMRQLIFDCHFDCSTYITISSYRATLDFLLLRPELSGITFIYIGTHVKPGHVRDVRSRGAKTEEEVEKEGHSIMLSTTWPLTVQKRGMRDAERGGGTCISLRSLRSDARPVRHQTSYIDHIIGRRSFRYTR